MVRRFGAEVFPIILSPLCIGVMMFDALSGSRYLLEFSLMLPTIPGFMGGLPDAV